MKTNLHRNSLLVLIVVGVIVAFVFTLYLTPSDSFNRAKVYFEPVGNFSMQVPSSFNIQREKVTEDEIILKVSAPNDIAYANPGLINVVIYKGAENKGLLEQAAAFLSVDPKYLIPFNYETPAYSYISQNGQELSYYYFFENGGNIIVYKFNKSYFDKNNPLILIDNSLYANTVLRSLNSINFTSI